MSTESMVWLPRVLTSILLQRARSSINLPLDIDGQITFAEKILSNYVDENSSVILIGHSLGGYLVMEMLRRNQQRQSDSNKERAFRIEGVIGICPALIHLAQSEGGIKVNVRVIFPDLETPYMLLILTEITQTSRPSNGCNDIGSMHRFAVSHFVILLRCTIHFWISQRCCVDNS